jgi:protein TonB
MKSTTTQSPLAWLCASLLVLGLLASHPVQAAEGQPPKILKKVPPEFPGEAVRKNITEGTVKARLSVDGQGAVTDVQIVEAMPAKARIFSEAAIAALSKWKFEPSGKGEIFEIKLVFSQE